MIGGYSFYFSIQSHHSNSQSFIWCMVSKSYLCKFTSCHLFAPTPHSIPATPFSLLVSEWHAQVPTSGLRSSSPLYLGGVLPANCVIKSLSHSNHCWYARSNAFPGLLINIAAGPLPATTPCPHDRSLGLPLHFPWCRQAGLLQLIDYEFTYYLH